ncbi:MAG TPA: hypothetical protein VGF24_13545 [Vicinamibacterales bacterium]
MKLPAKTPNQKSYREECGPNSSWDVNSDGPRRDYKNVVMPPLSEYASFILDRMEPDRRYEQDDLRGLVPDTGIEGLREIMHELWINRQVERVGSSGWRRHRSAPPHLRRPVRREVQPAKPEDLFDHETFADFFK